MRSVVSATIGAAIGCVVTYTVLSAERDSWRDRASFAESQSASLKSENQVLAQSLSKFTAANDGKSRQRNSIFQGLAADAAENVITAEITRRYSQLSSYSANDAATLAMVNPQALTALRQEKIPLYNDCLKFLEGQGLLLIESDSEFASQAKNSADHWQRLKKL